MRTHDPVKVVAAYRAAAMEEFGITAEEASRYILTPAADTGEWAPRALAIIRLEHQGGAGDTGEIPARLSCYHPDGPKSCIRLSAAAGVGYIEYINSAVAAVWPT